MSILHYVHAYVKTNYFLVVLIVVLAVISTIKYTGLARRIPTGPALAGTILLGLALRIAWLGFSSYEPLTAWTSGHMLESDVTNVHAIEITKGIWFHDMSGVPVARRPIGYPVFLAAIYGLFGVNTLYANVANLLLYAVAAWLVFLIGKSVFSETAGLIAAFLFSIYPISIYSIKLITDEHLFLPLWYAGLYLLLRDVKGSPLKGALFWYGVIFGYAAMTRTHAIFMPLAVALAYALVKRPWKKVAAAFVVTALVMQLVNAPWIVRNYRIWKVPVLYTLTGDSLYQWVNSNATPESPGALPQAEEPGYSTELDEAIRGKRDGRAHVLGNREMGKWIASHPLRFFELGTARALHFMCWNRLGVWPIWFQYYEGSYDPARPLPQAARDALEEAAYIFYYILLYSFIAALVLLWRRRRELSGTACAGVAMLFACIVLWCMEQMIIFPDRKYRFPLEPLMMMFAAFFFEYLMREFRWERALSGFGRRFNVLKR